MLKYKDYAKDIEYIILILNEICVKNDYAFQYTEYYFSFNVNELKKEKRLVHKFTLQLKPSMDIYGLNIYHNAWDNKFILFIPLYMNINSLIPSIINTYIDNIILYRKKILEAENIFTKHLEISEMYKDPSYIRDLKINNLLNNF